MPARRNESFRRLAVRRTPKEGGREGEREGARERGGGTYTVDRVQVAFQRKCLELVCHALPEQLQVEQRCAPFLAALALQLFCELRGLVQHQLQRGIERVLPQWCCTTDLFASWRSPGSACPVLQRPRATGPAAWHRGHAARPARHTQGYLDRGRQNPSEIEIARSPPAPAWKCSELLPPNLFWSEEQNPKKGRVYGHE